jgi:hypothetical protein
MWVSRKEASVTQEVSGDIRKENEQIQEKW